MRPRVALTVGDPAGIGPEIAGKAAANPRVLDVCEPVVYSPSPSPPAAVEPGLVSATAGRAAYDIVRAVEDAMAGRVDAIATAPVSKEAFALAGLPWRGHTRSPRAPDRNAVRGDDVRFSRAACRARDRPHRARRRAACAHARPHGPYDRAHRTIRGSCR